MSADDLTPSQVEILRHLVQGKTNAQIASATGLTAATVRAYLTIMYEKARVNNRFALVCAAMRDGWI